MTTINIKQLGSDKSEGKHYHIGQYFLIDDEVYLLAQTGYSEVTLIGLTSANRLDDPIKVKDVYRITEKELNPEGMLLSSVDIGWKL